MGRRELLLGLLVALKALQQFSAVLPALCIVVVVTGGGRRLQEVQEHQGWKQWTATLQKWLVSLTVTQLQCDAGQVIWYQFCG